MVGRVMTFERETYVSAAVSLGFHFIFILFAGTYFMSQQAHVPPKDEPFNLKFVEKKLPPPVEKKKPEKKKIKRKEIELKPLKPLDPLPMTKPVAQQVPVTTQVKVTPVAEVVPLQTAMATPTATPARQTVSHSVAPVVPVVTARNVPPVAQSVAQPSRNQHATTTQVSRTVVPQVVARSAPATHTTTAQTSRASMTSSRATTTVTASIGSAAPRNFQPTVVTTGSSHKSGLIRKGTARAVVGQVSARRVMTSSQPQVTRAATSAQGSSAARVAIVAGAPKALAPSAPSRAAGKAQSRLTNSHVRVASVTGSAKALAPAETGTEKQTQTHLAYSGPARAKVALPSGGPKPMAMTDQGAPGEQKSMLVASRGVNQARVASRFMSRAVPDISDQTATQGYLRGLKSRIERAKRYPTSAKRKNQEGRLEIQFRVLANGDVDGLKLVKKTPYPALNKEAILAVRRAAPFPIIPSAIGREYLDVILPFRFELN